MHSLTYLAIRCYRTKNGQVMLTTVPYFVASTHDGTNSRPENHFCTG